MVKPMTQTLTASPTPAPAARPRSWALFALVLVAAMPSLSVVNKFYFNLGAVGSAFFLLGKVWVTVIPLVWLKLIERRPWSLSPPRRGGLFVGAILGFAIAGSILGAFTLVSPHINRDAVRDWAIPLGMDKPAVFISAAVAYCLFNALMEEFVWRWFVFARLEEIFWPAGKPRPEELQAQATPAEGTSPATAAGAQGSAEPAETPAAQQPAAPTAPGPVAGATLAAVIITALLFTVHHFLALNSTLILPLTVLASTGVLIGGLAWSWLYQRYRSIWPGFIAHALADAAIFVGVWPLIAG